MKQLLYIIGLIVLAALCQSCETRLLRIGKPKVVTPAPAPATPATPAETVDIENRQYLARNGRRAFTWGLGILVGGGILSAAFKMYLPRKVGDIVYYAGGGLSLYGLVLMESAKRLYILGFVAIVVVGGLLLWKFKTRGFGKEANK